MSARFTEEWLANRLAKQGAVSRTASALSERTEAGREYRLVIYGEPQPAGSKQAFPLLENPRRICNCGSVPGPAPLRRGNGAIIVNVTNDNKEDLTETIITIALALTLLVVTTYSLFGAQLSALITQAFAQIPK